MFSKLNAGVCALAIASGFVSLPVFAQETTSPAESLAEVSSSTDTVPVTPSPALTREPPVARFDAQGVQEPLKVIELQDGRKLTVFASDEKLPPLPQGHTRQQIAGKLVGYLSDFGPAGLLPHKVKTIVKSDGPYSVLKTGVVGKDDDLIRVPFQYNRVFRMTKDHVVKPMLLKEMTYAKAGTLGYYAGAYPGGQMVCYFPEREGAISYKWSLCGVNFAGMMTTRGVFQLVTTRGNLPLSYSVTTMYGASTAPVLAGFESELADVKIPYDFSLTIRFEKWSKKGVVLNWQTEGNYLFAEVYPLNAEGNAVADFAEGRLTIIPDKKNKKSATVSWEPKA